MQRQQLNLIEANEDQYTITLSVGALGKLPGSGKAMGANTKFSEIRRKRGERLMGSRLCQRRMSPTRGDGPRQTRSLVPTLIYVESLDVRRGRFSWEK